MASEAAPMPPNPSVKAKVALLGDGAVGKTSLFRRFTKNDYSEEYLQTIGTNVSAKLIQVPDRSGIVDLKLQVWDIMGQGRFERLVASSLVGTQGLFLVCDVTRTDSIHSLRDWAGKASEVLDDPPFIIIANKVDIAPPGGEYLEDLWAMAGELHAPVLFTSAKEATGVEEAFSVMGRYIVYDVDQGRSPGAPRPQREIDPVVLALDHLITMYCKLNGGFEVTMPRVQEAFAKVEGDLDNPTPDLVRELMDVLAPLGHGPADQPDPAAVYREILNIFGPRTEGPTPFLRTKTDVLTPLRVANLTMGELLYQCQKRKLPTTGSASDLRERLLGTLD